MHGVQVHKQPASLEAPTAGNEDSTLADFIEDESETPPGEEAIHHMLTQDMNNMLYTLSEREGEVLRLRYGLDDGTERTLEEVGRIMMVSAAVITCHSCLVESLADIGAHLPHHVAHVAAVCYVLISIVLGQSCCLNSADNSWHITHYFCLSQACLSARYACMLCFCIRKIQQTMGFLHHDSYVFLIIARVSLAQAAFKAP